MEIVEKIKKRIALNENSLKTIDFGIETTGAIEEENKFLNELLIICSSSSQLKEKYKTDFDVWAINKGYTKMEGEWVKEPETYNEEFLLQIYNEELENL